MNINFTSTPLTLSQNYSCASAPLKATALPATHLSQKKETHSQKPDLIKGTTFFAGIFGGLSLIHQKLIKKSKSWAFLFAGIGAAIGYIHSEKH